MGGKNKNRQRNSQKQRNGNKTPPQTEPAGERGGKGKATEKPSERGTRAVWEALTCIRTLILTSISTLWCIVVWPFRLFAPIVYWIYQVLASIVLWIYRRLASIVIWIYQLLASIAVWIYNFLASVAAWMYKLPASLKTWLLSFWKNGDDRQNKFARQFGETSPLTNQHKIQRVSVYTQVTKDINKEFHDKVKGLQYQNKTLQDQNKTLWNQNKTLQDEKKALQDQKKALQDQKKALQDQNNALQEKAARFQGQNTALQDQNKTLQDEKKALQDQKKALQDQKKALQDQNNALQEKAARFQDALRRASEQYQAEITRLNLQIKNLLNKTEEQKTRLSKMASDRMRENNSTVEDLNDPHRPTALVSKWTSLFRCGEYWTAYEEVMSAKGEHEAASILYEICRVVYDSVKKYVDDLMETFQPVVTASDLTATPPTVNKEIEGCLSQEEREDFLDALRTLHSRLTDDDVSGKYKTRKLIVDLLKSRCPPDSMTKMVDEALHQGKVFDPSLVKKFTDQLGRLVYYMRAQEIPMVVYFQGSEGATFDPSLFEVEGSTGTVDPKAVVIKSVIRPVVLRNESGPVLSKGEVEVMSRSEWRAEENHKSEAERQASSAKSKVADSPSGESAEDHAKGADDETTGAENGNQPAVKEISPAGEKVTSSSCDPSVQPKVGNNAAAMEGNREAEEKVEPAEQEVVNSSPSIVLGKPDDHSTEEQKRTEEEVSQAHSETPSSSSSKAESEELNAQGKMKDPSDLGTTSAPPGEGKSLHDMSDCVNYPLPDSDDEGNDNSMTNDTDKKKIAKEEANQMTSYMDGTAFSVSPSSSTSCTDKAAALDKATKERLLDANSPKESPSGPDEPDPKPAKPAHETAPSQEISVEAGDDSDTKAKPSGDLSVSNQATSPDPNVRDPSESTGETGVQHLEQSSSELTTLTCAASGSFSGAEEKSSLLARSRSQQMQPESDDKKEDHTETTANENLKMPSKSTGKGENFAAPNAVIEKATATDQEPGQVPVDPTTSQNCHTEVSGNDGNNSTDPQ